MHIDDERKYPATTIPNSARVARWAGTLGVLVPAAAIPVYPIWAFPSTAASGADIVLWVSAHHDRLVMTQVLYTAGVGCWLIFGAAVWTQLRCRIPVGSLLATGFNVGMVGLTMLILSGFTVFDILLYRPRSAELSTLLYDLAFGLLVMSGVPTVVASGSFALAVYRYGPFRRSTAHLASLAAAGHVILLVAFIAPTGPFSLQGALTVWGIPLLLFAWIGHTAQASLVDQYQARQS
ncbi:hypothetical protein [Mycobacterium sp. 1423905.2]|uniref:hypothetical protein n=1 Tax=Mycobacterium sp. 1423905.2 TaxID=1856859 RepID=UPI0007FD54C9|nr:hypothetical protein [Mycobacterium sp. 1423905.2]OBJ52376.1 hypothetical protein A9W95_20220 [Mycobacterium sp. 1423905.2]